ncbi:MAG: hypothetical protein LUG85_02170 [Clostridiales bacterium]|nr:hypothetical protein [Clostridiales bacterium]MCD7827329.1 hypothetical protein [Clostridiales bacterium]
MKDFLEKIKRDKKLIIIMAVGLFGAVLLLVSSFDIDGDTAESSEETDCEPIVISSEDIEESLESRLKNMVESIDGAGNAEVMISVDSTGEYVYAENTKSDEDADSYSGENEIVIFEQSDGSDAGLIISVKNPEIRGVAVICDGGDSSSVKAEITKMVTNLFGIGSDRVYVGAKKNG